MSTSHTLGSKNVKVQYTNPEAQNSQRQQDVVGLYHRFSTVFEQILSHGKRISLIGQWSLHSPHTVREVCCELVDPLVSLRFQGVRTEKVHGQTLCSLQRSWPSVGGRSARLSAEQICRGLGVGLNHHQLLLSIVTNELPMLHMRSIL